MEPDNKYIPIAQFAKLVNLSPAAIYKRIKAGDESILTHVTEIDGKKRISTNALELFGVTGDESDARLTSTVDNRLLLVYEEELTFLKAEMEKKDVQITNKDEQIKAYITQIAEHKEQLDNKDKQIAELNQSVRESHYIAAAAAGKQIESADTEQQDPEKKGFWGWLKNKLK